MRSGAPGWHLDAAVVVEAVGLAGVAAGDAALPVALSVEFHRQRMPGFGQPVGAAHDEAHVDLEAPRARLGRGHVEQGDIGIAGIDGPVFGSGVSHAASLP